MLTRQASHRPDLAFGDQSLPGDSEDLTLPERLEFAAIPDRGANAPPDGIGQMLQRPAHAIRFRVSKEAAKGDEAEASPAPFLAPALELRMEGTTRIRQG